jgi:hypothetical protein
LKELPVVILTDCNFVEDVSKAYHLGAHSYFLKFARFKDAVEMCLSLQRYRQDVNAGKAAIMPEPVWPGRHALRMFPPDPFEGRRFPVAW